MERRNQSKIRVTTYFCLVALLSCLSFISYGQNDVTIIPPSPETSELFKYQHYPMDYSTGLPQINIPIYEVKSGSLSVPISLSYHADGCKVTDRSGPIGVGWSLNAGGEVARTIHGSEDFGQYPFPDPFVFPDIGDHTTDLAELAYLENIVHERVNMDLSPQGHWTQSEYDIYSYSFGGNSGKFIFKDEGGVKTPVLLNNKPYKIIHNLSGSTMSANNSITIIDDKGVTYLFGGGSERAGGKVTSYKLKKIISADKTDTITFVYDGFYQKRIARSQSWTVIDRRTWIPTININGRSQIDPNIEVRKFHEHTNDIGYQISRLTEIQFSQGRVLFNPESDDSQSEGSIGNIQILDNQDHIIRTINFERSDLHSLSEMGFSTHKLDDMIVLDKTGAPIENYSFEYFPTPPYPSGKTQMNYRHVDWWGYYNASGKSDMVPLHSVRFQQYLINSPVNNSFSIGEPTADRAPDLAALKSGVLKKITFPTGGSTEFTYGHNKYQSGTFYKVGPGLRVEEMKTTESTGNVSIKTFKYGIGESGYGKIDLEVDLNKMWTEQRYDWFNAPFNLMGRKREGYYKRTYYDGFHPGLSELAAIPVTYEEVTQYDGTSNNNIGKTIYKYSRHLLSPPSNINSHWFTMNYNYWNNPKLLVQTEFEFERIGTGINPVYHKRRETVNTYSTKYLAPILGLHVQTIGVMPQTNKVPHSLLYPSSFAVEEISSTPLIYATLPYQLDVGEKNLSSTTATTFNEDGSEFTTSTSYVYNAEQLPSKITTISSDDLTLETQITYPFDYTSDPVLTQMASPAVNMLNFPIEHIELKDGRHVKSVRTNYLDWGGVNSMIAPESIDVKEGANPYETRFLYEGYDSNGNPIGYNKLGDIRRSYLWGYNGEYVISSIENASYDQVLPHVGGSVSLSDTESTAGVEATLRTSLNNIRTSLPDAMVTTYTYDPLIGMTSKTDPNNSTTYFEYDEANRLELIRDKSRYILETREYAIAEQNLPQIECNLTGATICGPSFYNPCTNEAIGSCIAPRQSNYISFQSSTVIDVNESVSFQWFYRKSISGSSWATFGGNSATVDLHESNFTISSSPPVASDYLDVRCIITDYCGNEFLSSDHRVQSDFNGTCP